MNYKDKYIKYKTKYFELKNMDITGAEIIEFITQHGDPYFWYNSINNLI